MSLYNPKSPWAEEFIHAGEIEESLEYAQKNKEDPRRIEEVLNKATKFRGLNHREALLLYAAEGENYQKALFGLAQKIKNRFYGRRIVLFAPLYLSNYCINGCVYCPYHLQNRDLPRHRLSMEEIRREVTALQDMGHKRLALELGEDPIHNPLDYVLEAIETIYHLKHKNGAIRRVNVNIAATTVEEYRRLKKAEIGTYVLFQETYHKKRYEALHPKGPKSDYAYHTEAMDRAMEAGIGDVGLGALFGLESAEYELAGLLMHAEHLEMRFGVGPHTISVPRIRPADDVQPESFAHALPEEKLLKLVAILRIAVPYTGLIMSTRESGLTRERALELGISQMSAASKTSVGGYDAESEPEGTEQFDIEDRRSLKEVVEWLMERNHIPSFCTACYRAGRTGDRFMEMVKNEKIGDLCQANALITLKEYLKDYAGDLSKGEVFLERELKKIDRGAIQNQVQKAFQGIDAGRRDFRL